MRIDVSAAGTDATRRRRWRALPPRAMEAEGERDERQHTEQRPLKGRHHTVTVSSSAVLGPTADQTLGPRTETAHLRRAHLHVGEPADGFLALPRRSKGFLGLAGVLWDGCSVIGPRGDSYPRAALDCGNDRDRGPGAARRRHKAQLLAEPDLSDQSVNG
ncbi:MAG: hypothetical protein ABIU87_11755 [Ornithinibacter sp.]